MEDARRQRAKTVLEAMLANLDLNSAMTHASQHDRLNEETVYERPDRHTERIGLELGLCGKYSLKGRWKSD